MGVDIISLKFEDWLWSLSGVDAVFIPLSTGLDAHENPLIKEALSAHVPPYRYVLTYYFLSQDMRSPSERSHLFKRMLSALHWKRGYIFLPHNFLKGEEIINTPRQFWSTVREINQRGEGRISYILIFGRDCARELVPNKEFRFGPCPYGEMRLLFLPSPDEMLPDNRELKNLVWHLLKRLPLPRF